MKRKFVFTDRNGIQQTDIEIFTDEPEYYLQLSVMKTNFYLRHRSLEKAWVKDELNKTDFIYMPDARVDGELIAGTEKHQDLVEYRSALHQYDCLASERPVRPEWFNS